MANQNNNENARFTRLQHEQIMEIFGEALRQQAENNARQQAKNNANNNPDAPGQTRPPSWRDSEVGFFQPDLDASNGDGDAITVGTDMVFRDVNLFID